MVARLVRYGTVRQKTNFSSVRAGSINEDVERFEGGIRPCWFRQMTKFDLDAR